MFEKINEKLDCLCKENLTHVFKKSNLLFLVEFKQSLGRSIYLKGLNVSNPKFYTFLRIQ